MTDHFVAVSTGSDSDLATMQPTLDTLDEPGVPWQVKIAAAHHTPATTHACEHDADAIPVACVAIGKAGAKDTALKEKLKR